MRHIRFEIPEPTPLLNVWQRYHWAKRGRIAKGFAWMVREALGPITVEPMQKCKVTIERHSAGTPDYDGLVGGVKVLLDCLVVCSKRNPHGLGLIQDDNPDCMDLEVIAVKCKRGERKTVIEIEEIL